MKKDIYAAIIDFLIKLYFKKLKHIRYIFYKYEIVELFIKIKF